MVLHATTRAVVDLGDVDFHLTASMYNLPQMYDGERLILVEGPSLIIVLRPVEDGVSAVAYGEAVTRDELVEMVAWRLGLWENYSDLYARAINDPILREVPTALRGWRLRSAPLWWSLVIAVAQQNASFRQGWRSLCCLVKLFGRGVELEDGDVAVVPPQPSDVIKLGNELKRCGLGYRVDTLIRIAEAYTSGENPLSVKGVGQYTARLASLLAYRTYSDPPIDRWVIRLVSETYGVDAGHRSVEEFLKARYGEWAGLAVLLYTIVLDAEPISKALNRVRRGDVRPVIEPSPATIWKSPMC